MRFRFLASTVTAWGVFISPAVADTACHTYDETGRLVASDYSTASTSSSIDYTLDRNDNRVAVDQATTGTPTCTTPAANVGPVPGGDLAAAAQSGGGGSGGGGGGSNTPPVAVDDFRTVAAGGQITISVLLNDTDAESHTLTITSVSVPLAGDGSANILPGATQIQYFAPSTPPSDWQAEVEYTISDGHGGTDTAIVYIDIFSM